MMLTMRMFVERKVAALSLDVVKVRAQAPERKKALGCPAHRIPSSRCALSPPMASGSVKLTRVRMTGVNSSGATTATANR